MSTKGKRRTQLLKDIMDGLRHRAVKVHTRIAARRRRADVLQQSEARFAKIFHASPLPISITTLADGRFRAVNDSFLRLLGYHREEVISRTSAELALWADPAERPQIVQALDEHQTAHEMEVRFCTKAGKIRVGLASKESIEWGGEPCVLSILRDITDRKQMEEALRASEERFRSLVQHSSDAILVMTDTGVIRYISPMAERILGYPLEAFLGVQAARFAHPEDRAQVRERFRTILRSPGVPVTFTARFGHQDGTWRVCEAVATNLLGDPAIAGIVLNARDITERQQAEERLRVLSSAVEQTADLVMITDREGVIEYANPAFEQLTGYPKDKILGNTPRILKSGQHTRTSMNSCGPRFSPVRSSGGS